MMLSLILTEYLIQNPAFYQLFVTHKATSGHRFIVSFLMVLNQIPMNSESKPIY